MGLCKVYSRATVVFPQFNLFFTFCHDFADIYHNFLTALDIRTVIYVVLLCREIQSKMMISQGCEDLSLVIVQALFIHSSSVLPV